MSLGLYRETKVKNYILLKVLLTILVILVASAIILVCNIEQNGGGITGLISTCVGVSVEESEAMPDLYVLILGKSENLTDTILVAKYSPQNKSASMLSIPRDTFVGDDSSKASAWDKINAKYMQSPETLIDKVNELTGLNIQYYFTVDTKALRDLVDALGGVEFDVPIDMDYDDVTQDLHIHVKAGLQTLDGETAEGVVRFRHNNDFTTYPQDYGDNDLGRMRTQREFLKVVLQKLKQPSTLTKIGKIIDIAEEEVETNLKWDTLKRYIPTLTEFNMENLSTNQLPGEAGYYNGVALFIANKKETLTLVKEMFLDEQE